MKKLKFLGFLVAVVLMAASLTSCMSNGDSTRTGVSYVYITKTMGTTLIRTVDGKTTFVASNVSQIPSSIEGLCIISYQETATNDTNSGTTSSNVAIQLTGIQQVDNAVAQALPASSFEHVKDTLATSDLKWKEASFINVVGVDLYKNVSLDLNATSTEFPLHKFEVAPSGPRLILGLNYGFGLASNKVIPYVFYLTYDDSKSPIQDGTLTLTLKHYVATKDAYTNLYTSAGMSNYIQQIYSFNLGEVLNRYNGGEVPSKIAIKIEQDNQGWTTGDTTEEKTLTGAGSWAAPSTTTTQK